MAGLMLPLVLAALVAADDSRPATEAEIERARQLFAGAWEIAALTDNGERLGAELVRRKVVMNGRITFVDRTVVLVDPESGEKRTVPFRLNPAASPRQIDFTNRNDRTLRGIYRFEGEELTLCVNHQEDGPRPAAFAADEGSNFMLVHLTLPPLAANTEPSIPAPGPASTTVPTPATTTPAAATTTPATPAIPPGHEAKPDAPKRDRFVDEEDNGRRAEAKPKPEASRRDRFVDEDDVRRSHELLTGTWDIVSITNDGDRLGPQLIKTKLAEKGQVRFGSRTSVYVEPRTGERRISALRIDPSKDPSQIDVTTRFDDVLKGIYKFEGDRLILCVAKHEEGERPQDFDAPGGSDRMLYELRMANPEEAPEGPMPAAVPLEKIKPVPAPAPFAEVVPAPAPSAADLQAQREDTIRQMMLGSWLFSDRKGTLSVVFRPDGSFIATRTWAKAVKRLFEGRTTTSEGRWTFGSSYLNARVTRSMDPKLLNHGYNFYVESIGANSLVFRDSVGEVQTLRKLR